MNWFVYMIRCNDGSLYTGLSTDVERRFAEHQSQRGKCAKYLRGKAPLELVYQLQVATRSLASQLEIEIKQMSKQQKEQLIEDQLLQIKNGSASRPVT